MYAIVEIAGQQFKVEGNRSIFVHRLEAEIGSEVKFDSVLLLEDEGNITVGEPTVKDAFIGAKVLAHVRGDKVIVFKKKRKKGYRIKNGHRQNFTQLEIININGKEFTPWNSAAKAAEVTEVVAEEKAASKKAAAVAQEAAPKAKKPAAKKAAKAKEE